jgi:murein DD-endopeptidase MepM/ murein hydrolase activator NlpD
VSASRPLILSLLPALLIGGCGGDPVEVAPSSASAAPEPAGEPAALPPLRPLLQDELRRGEGLDAPLKRLGLDDRERWEVAGALEGVADVRGLPAGAGVGVVRVEDGSLERVVLRTGPWERVVVEGGPEGLVSRSEELPRSSETRVLEATLESSVYEALLEAGGTPELVVEFSDVFQWDLDFFADPREGDRLAVLFEMHRPGETPPRTPLWRGREESERPEELGRILAASYRGKKVSVDGLYFDDPEAGPGYYDPEGRSLRKTFLKSPLNYRRISSGYSRARRNPVTRKVVPHHGVDYAARTGTPVVASADGRVLAAGWKGALGRHVHLRHGSGRYETRYGHLSRIARGIRPGATVRQNQVIGYVGATGRATGPHLHYEVHRDGHSINPLRMENPPTGPVSEGAREAFARERDRLMARLTAGSEGPRRASAHLGDEAGAYTR